MSYKQFVNYLLVTLQVSAFSVLAELIKSNSITIEEKLDSSENLTAILAEEVCLDLMGYQDQPTSSEECIKNFLGTQEVTKDVPPAMQLKCRLTASIKYNTGPVDVGAMSLVVLTPINTTVLYLPYNLMQDNTQLGVVNIPSPGRYRVWSSLIHPDGSRSPWRRGPEVHTWNSTGDVQLRNYTIHVKMEHAPVNGVSKVRAVFSWDSFDEDDTCFHFVNSCDGRHNEIEITPNMGRSAAMSQLPLGTACEARLSGRYGSTRHLYRTPRCSQLQHCVDFEKVHNLSVHAEAGAQGWTVRARWARPERAPRQYNVTLFTERAARSVVVPGNESGVSFAGVTGGGVYDVAVGAVRGRWTAYTSARAIFPDRLEGRALGAAGGAWAALGALAAAAAAAVLLWRRRRPRPHHHIYFEEPLDKLPKDSSAEPVDVESVTEDQWELRPERLLLHEVVGEGAFGVVRRGTLAPHGREVAVKMLKDFPTLEEVRSFRQEMELMKSVGAHPHVVSLVGCCSRRRPLIVAEYCSRGDLLTFLRCSWDVMVSKRNAKYYNNNIESSDYRNDLFKCKPQGEHSKLVVNKLYDLQGVCDTDLTTRDLLSFCRQIAMGMEFLASNRLVHRDLAARNVLVASDRTLKIADFGLSRDVYEENQYKQKGNGKMPMKWMALESLTHRIYTTQSDVWSFGVVMWEVASVGCSPYAGVAGARLPRLLRAGYRMPRPGHCPPALYELMLACWRAHPRERPTFGELHARLDEQLNRACAGDYLRLDLDERAPPPPINYVRMILRSKLGWSRGAEPYERPLRAASATNHYSSPPAALARLPLS